MKVSNLSVYFVTDINKRKTNDKKHKKSVSNCANTFWRKCTNVPISNYRYETPTNQLDHFYVYNKIISTHLKGTLFILICKIKENHSLINFSSAQYCICIALNSTVIFLINFNFLPFDRLRIQSKNQKNRK